MALSLPRMVVGRGLYQQCFYLSDRKPAPPLGFQAYVERFPKSYQNAAQKSAHELDNLFKLKTDGNIDIQGATSINGEQLLSFLATKRKPNISMSSLEVIKPTLLQLKHVSNPHAKEFLDKAPRSPKTTDDQSLKAQPIQTSSKQHVAKASKQTLQKPLPRHSNELSLETYDNVKTKNFETISSQGSKAQPCQTTGTPRTKASSSSKKDNSFSSNLTETIVPPKPVLSEEKKASEAQTKTKSESPTEQSLDETSETLKPLGDKIKAHKVKKMVEKYQSEESLQKEKESKSDAVQFKGQPKKVTLHAIDNSTVHAVVNSAVHAVVNSVVQSEENSAIEAKGNSTGQSVENLTLQALGNSTVQSVENTAVQEKENSTVQSVENSAVQVKENSTVQSVENSAVQEKGNSTLVLKDNSTVQPKSETNAAHYEAKLTKVDNFVQQTDKPVTNSSKDLSNNVNKDSVQPLPEQYIKKVNKDLRQSSTGFFSSIRNSFKSLFRK